MRTPRLSNTRLIAASFAVATMVFMPIQGALAARPRPADAAPKFEAPGALTIMSTTTGAEVEVDGKSVGALPMEDAIVVTPGVHKIRVYLRGWTEFIDTFEVKAGEDIELEIDLIPFAGIVKINTGEPGATVKIDGKVEGVTPFDKDVPVGKKAIVISRPGYYDETRDLQIQAGQEYVLDVALREVPGGTGGGGPEFYETWWFWTIVGVVGAGTATAVAVSSGGGQQAPPTASFTLQIP